MKKNSFILGLCALMATLMVACNTNYPEQKELEGTWSEPLHVNVTVKSLTFNTDGSAIYIDQPDTTSVPVIDWGGNYAKMHYSVNNHKLCFSGMSYFLNKEAKRDSMTFKFFTDYSIEGNKLTIDSFAYDGGIETSFIKLLTLIKQ